jgi:hemerythrin-like metal-binding protein
MQPMTENNEPIGWNDSLVLGYAPMDHMHEEFVRIIGRMQTGPDAELSAWLAQFIVHAQAHFEEENAWMTDTEFPPRACHMEQHQAVLNSAHEVQQLLVQGDISTCRKFAQALADWFPNHTDHLDSALAHWMFKRHYGGKPVVFRQSQAFAQLEPDHMTRG